MADTTKITARGPLLEGHADEIVNGFLSRFAQVVSQDAFSEVSMLLDASIVNPTPYYETQITSDRRADDWVVHDRGVIYGPWLEGTSSRNRTTRFKGYASFRRATQTVQARVPLTVERIVRDLAHALGG